MDRISKQLGKLSEKERKKLKAILYLLNQGKFSGLDIKKLKDRQDLFRVRKGDIRIIFRVLKNRQIFILAVERRSEDTYK